MAGLKQIFKSQLTDIDTSPMEPLGTIRFELNAVFKYVKFSGSNAVAAGDAVCYVATDTNNQTVDGAQTVQAAGLAMAAVATAGGIQYGWIQIKGVQQVNTSWTVPGAVGNALTSVGATYPALAVSAAASSPQVGTVVKTGAAATGVINCDFPF